MLTLLTAIRGKLPDPWRFDTEVFMAHEAMAEAQTQRGEAAAAANLLTETLWHARDRVGALEGE